MDNGTRAQVHQEPVGHLNTIPPQMPYVQISARVPLSYGHHQSL